MKDWGNEIMDEKKLRAERMFAKLKENIGKKVLVKRWEEGIYYENSGTLEYVTDFGRANVGCLSMPFIGHRCAIISIEDMNGQPLYIQPLVEPYDVSDELEIIEIIRDLFGDEIADKKMEEYKEEERAMAEYERKEAEKISQFKESGSKEIIEKTLPYVVEAEKEGFIRMVNNNSDSCYGIAVVRMTAELIIAIGDGMDFDEAIDTIAVDKYGTSGFAMGWAANAISHCSARGEEFKKYWNGLHGIPDEEPGVVNPAIITIETSKKRRK